ncbi:MAG: TIGR00730 family Rossman fold protein [Desulfobacteraceae bacterium]|nr:MAG: TIGR00730 family Rossman fold protein [Desulfobacteraceae bacterium]
MKLNNVCVYCGSSPGRIDLYAESARTLAAALVDRNIGLVYGGASVGLMGLVADSVLTGGGRVTGVIPQAMVEKEIVHNGLTNLHITKSMHERKTIMSELSDGFIALPGGIGTLEELFEIWNWAELGYHQKPCGLLNIANYFDGLIGFLEHSVAEKFVKKSHFEMLIVESEPGRILERFTTYVPTYASKWEGLTAS